MENYELYIRNKKVDLNEENSSILFTYQKSDYENPTAIKNSFTKQLNIPGTKRNNEIFNEVFKLYRTQDSSIFNPSKRESFVLLKGGILIETGYAKLDEVVRNNTYCSYTVTLYGELGNILYRLTYDYDNIDEEIKLTLGDLTYEYDLGFTINRTLIRDAWNRLHTVSENDTTSLYDTLNFCIAYNGIPSDADNFEPKKSAVVINGQTWSNLSFTSEEDTYTGLPIQLEDDEKTYTPISYYGMNAVGIMETDTETTSLEMRDFRSYLQRPVIRLKKVIEAIGNYMYSHTGYRLDLSDPFFQTSEYFNSWITLSMLYEIKSTVESGTSFTQKELLSLTSSPSSYLTSLCKTYGLFLNLDTVNKVMTLIGKERFYKGDLREEVELNIDELKITPLSFSKNYYTLDYSEGESEGQKKYKEVYGIQYGSKKIKTGYEFGTETEQLIQNNVFRNGNDALETSLYYKANNYPIQLTPTNSSVSYTLFNKNNSNEITSKSITLWKSVEKGALYGYYLMNQAYNGKKYNCWLDGIPRLQCHSEDNKSADGSNILVRYNGKAKIGAYDYWGIRTPGRYYNDPTYYISDDIPEVKEYIGSNCWTVIDSNPSNAGLVSELYYMTYYENIPMFTRCTYNFSDSTYKITDSLDFSKVKELYIPATEYSSGDVVLYDKYWKKYIQDLYSVSTRVITARMKIDSTFELFRKFYHWENSYWIISKITDYDYTDFMATVTFIKVNDIDNYSSYVYLVLSQNEIGSSGGTITGVAYSSTGESITLSSTESWAHPTIIGNAVSITIDPNVNNNRYTTITATSGTNTTTVTIKQSTSVANKTLTVNATPDTATITLT